MTTRVSQYQILSIPQYLQVPALVSAQPPLPRQVRPGTRFPIITIFITNSYQYVYQHDHHPPVYQHLCKLFWKFLDVPEVKFDKKNSIIDVFALLPAIYLNKVLQIIPASLFTPGRLWEKSAPNYTGKPFHPPPLRVLSIGKQHISKRGFPME